ncbi:MAG TPA: GlsB/YeaQ/YmgE family stress response membrane protein [Polyangia bacterium]|jgi:uncharacterized membrane protein YeaQ/YmgE (transglycosylase-associated protein family)
MHIVWMLLIGFVIGAVASLLMPGRPGGVLSTILVGLGGSFLAGFVGRAVGWYRGPVDGPGIIASILGAMLLLFLFRIVVDRRHGGTV